MTAMTGKRDPKRVLKRIDAQIAEVYQRRCKGITINIMDISKVYEAGRMAVLSGADLEQAVVVKVQQLAAEAAEQLQGGRR